MLPVVFPHMSSGHTSSKHAMYFHKRLRVGVFVCLSAHVMVTYQAQFVHLF